MQTTTPTADRSGTNHVKGRVSPMDSDTKREPLRIGILGAARIADPAVVHPAALAGARVVAIAARDHDRAQAYASARGIPTAYGDYESLLADPTVEVVYNPTPNSLHVEWTLAAIRAGKHVFTEKPLASNAEEARLVAPAAAAAGVVVFEAFHYRYHPVYNRFLELLKSGAIGELKQLDVSMKWECSDLHDIRWSWPLSGGCLMDVGCYTIHVARDVSAILGDEPDVLSCRTGPRPGADPRIDAWAHVSLLLPGGATAALHADLNAARSHSILATGRKGTLFVPNYINPHDDDRIILRTPAGEVVEHHGRETTYRHQLEALVAAIRQGAPFPTTATDGIANMEMIDECYRLADLPLRESAPA
ncbi:Gfo/Idh/MocA family protein [Tessaracoccus sp. Z1128]